MTKTSAETTPSRKNGVPEVSNAIVRFAGDSGDGMQLVGVQFTNTTALVGNDLATLPDFPAEIRAPQGSLAGVSGYQIQFGDVVHTPGDAPDVLVAMNPAALKVNVGDVVEGGIILANSNAFNDLNLKKAGYTSNPLEDGSLSQFRVLSIPLTDLTVNALAELGIKRAEAERSRNIFALGIAYWLFDRPLDPTVEFIRTKFSKSKLVSEANEKALRAGYNYAETTEIFNDHFRRIKKAAITPGTYRNISGNEATALGFIAAAKLAGLPLFYGSYPITPASDVLHELAKFKHYDVKTFQAEDEIAAVASAIGASFAGNIGLTGTSGPGVCLKSEAIGLAVSTELPLIIIDVQRGGPSTGLPTKTEQADLLQAMFGRNGECPVAIVAPASPVECFELAIFAVRIAIKYRTPVFYLSDGYIGNGLEPWRIPDPDKLQKIEPNFRTDVEGFFPFLRDPDTLARPWAIPGTKGLEHRLGGLEKSDITGSVDYSPGNHQKMVNLRAEKVARISQDIPGLQVLGPQSGKLLILGWGGTLGAITTAAERLKADGHEVSTAHLRYLNPFPDNLGEVLNRFEHVLIPELNKGQLNWLIRAKFLKNTHSLSKVAGRPFQINEIKKEALRILKEGK